VCWALISFSIGRAGFSHAVDRVNITAALIMNEKIEASALFFTQNMTFTFAI
jgi:hypothetical protein